MGTMPLFSLVKVANQQAATQPPSQTRGRPEVAARTKQYTASSETIPIIAS